jgi:hypothetical protein
MVVENRFEGKLYKPGIEASKGASGDGIVYLAPFHDLDSSVPVDVKERLSQLTQDIIDKKIAVPERYKATVDIMGNTEFGGQSYTVTGTSTDGKVTAVTINSGRSVMLQFDKAGDVELTLPKSMIDGISMVKAGDNELTFETLSSTETQTTIKFTVPDGGNSVEIYGASVVPEFGVIATLLLAALLVAVIGLARFKGILPGLGRL